MGFNKQHIGDNEGMGTGLGGTNLKSLVSGYTWQNAQAETYYNALKTANGGDINSLSLYGIGLNTYKGAIDTFFVTGNTDGWLTNINILYLFQGNISGTQSINAVNPGSFDLTFINSPTYGQNGVTTDGATQYFKTGYIAGIELVNQNNMSVFGKLNSFVGSFYPYLSCVPSTSVRMQLGNSASVGTFSDAYNTTLSQGRLAVAESRLTFNHYTRRSSIDAEMYVNGVSTGTSITGGGTIPSAAKQDLWGGVQNDGSGNPSANFGQGTMEIVGSGIDFSDAEALSLYNAYATFATTIGR